MGRGTESYSADALIHAILNGLQQKGCLLPLLVRHGCTADFGCRLQGYQAFFGRDHLVPRQRHGSSGRQSSGRCGIGVGKHISGR